MIIFSLYVVIKQKQTKSNKGFNFDKKYFSQNLDDFRKSMQITYWLSQKAKQLEDDFRKGISGLSQEGGGITFFSLPPSLSDDR